MSSLEQTVNALHQGQVIAYPTEGVFGLGCDPDRPQAIERLLAIKQRPKEKGLILIAADFSQLELYVDLDRLTSVRREQIFASWPGPITWVLPASDLTSRWVTGQFDTVAVRVSDHPLVVSLCEAFGKPIISTSANLSGQPAALHEAEVERQFGGQIAAILSGQTGGRNKPSRIMDGLTGDVLREG
ncbi:L-threonylcarbamoyladenylate synthase [Celerinatantimonas yamalensis]|uniref:Threonylcarbamoyl-AMP synthase n=1 Tax=Celerinatantimonas yamalensis TaxID=559956 RepID=A0ABW9GB39_9GAMM